MRPMSDQQLIENAEIIIQGTVISKEIKWVNNNQFIYTFVKIRTDKVIDGDTEEGHIQTIAIPGGYDPVKDIGVGVSNQASFEVGEEAVVFLEKAEGNIDAINYNLIKNDVENFENMKRVSGYRQGKQQIYTDPTTKKRMIFKSNEDKEVQLDEYKTTMIQSIKKIRKATSKE